MAIIKIKTTMKMNEREQRMPESPADKAKKQAAMKKAREAKKQKEQKPEQLAEYKYIGDDGGRWIFERRKDKRVVTIDKPMNLPAANPSETPVRLMAHGFRVSDDVIALCRK